MREHSKQKKDLLSYIRDGRKLTYGQQLLLVARLSIPAIMAQLTSVIMQYIDASMVGRLGANQSASIGLVSTTTWLFGSVCMSFTVGFVVQAAQYIGGNDNESARRVLRQALVFMILLSVLVAGTGIAICRELPAWLGGAHSLWKDSSAYFFVYVCSIPAMAMNSLAGSMLQCSGNMKTPSVLNVIMCILDVIFNVLFIFPGHNLRLAGYVFYIPGMNMGVFGAALGTGVAQFIVAVLMLYFLCVRSPELHLHRGEHISLRNNCYKKACKIALPIAFEHLVVCGAMIVTTRIVAPLGTVALAANSFAITAESLCYMPGYGIGDAATTLIGQSIGAGREKLVRHFSRMTVMVGIGVMTVTGVIMYTQAHVMIAMLSPDARVQSLGALILRIEAFAEPMYAASIVATGALRGAGDTLIPSLMNFVSLWCVRLPLSFLLVGRYGLMGVWIAMCLELIFRGVLFLYRLCRGHWIRNM